MATDNWIDTFACLSRWDVDGFHLVGMRLSDLVNTNSRAIPLKYIAKVSLKTVTEEHAFGVRLTVQAERGSAPFWKEHSQHQTSDSFTTLLQNGVALRQVLWSTSAFMETGTRSLGGGLLENDDICLGACEICWRTHSW